MNIGIIIPHLGLGQSGFYAITEVNRLVEMGHKSDFVLFFEQVTMPILQPQCGTMCINELMSFKGTLITTTLNNTAMALARSSRSENKIIFYVWDLEWLRPNQNNYLHNFAIYNTVHKLVARSQEHTNALENYCSRKVDLISPDFNIDEMINE